MTLAPWLKRYFAKATEAEGERQGRWDGAHTSHLKKRDPEVWEAFSNEYRKGYERAWNEAHG